MPILSEKESSQNMRSNSFLYIQKFPWSAYQRDIRELFKDFSIKKGGILIRGSLAFVAFEDPLDLVAAVCQKERSLHGFEIQMSVISYDELQKILMRNVRRQLDFGHLPRCVAKSCTNVPRRKIRPTPVDKGVKRRAMSSSEFLSAETVLPFPQCTTTDVIATRFICGKKKVHPTRISDAMDSDNFEVFHPEQYYEVKKIKLDIHSMRAIVT